MAFSIVSGLLYTPPIMTRRTIVLCSILLLALGVDQVSVAPPVVLPEMKKIIRTVRYQDAQTLVEEMLACADPDEAMHVMMDFNRKLFPMLFP